MRRPTHTPAVRGTPQAFGPTNGTTLPEKEPGLCSEAPGWYHPALAGELGALSIVEKLDRQANRDHLS
jgi:hypothetical protein